ncbi:F-box/kelch-repeat protein At1g23390-like [Cynara cardunculus var. scolymus]|uniref:F-box domain, cyclin-like protein n=1 Tax=Cynara cardunculus var. scolymus TaxID=59895 RepID=A0A103XRM1_CYNCS|nr:F-box/kelch-repeat protein At1g23390-like [Cynara cardunculus var. scolymus]KVH95615.1 F-box domain, cyclin-like protein [Cynara cardunculus var. scolymus]
MDTCNEQLPIHGDVLEAVLSHLPLIRLLPASRVSKSWNAAVSSALLVSNNTKPWLIIHTQNSRHPYPTTTHAYDPASNVWIQILHPPIHYVSTLRSSQSNLLYMLSQSKLSLSFDPLHLTWHHAAGPKVSRIDPVVAVVGGHVVVAGGAYDFEDDPLAVEVYDLRSQRWTKSDPMPESFNQSASSLWLSVASGDSHLFVMEKSSGVTHSFNPNNDTWSGPYDMRPDDRVFYSVIGFSDDKLVVIGMLGDAEDVDGIKLWEVNCESFEFEEIGEMPASLVENLKSQNLQISSIDVSMGGNMAYIYISSRPEEVIVCEFIDGGGCRWCSVVNTVANGWSVMDKLAFTCSKVGMEELQRATRSESRRFVVKR